MGYSTAFTGQFALSRPLTADECATLRALYEHRHEEEEDLPLPYVVAGDCPVLIERTLKNRTYYGEAPGILSKKFPSFYCQWVLSPDQRALEWDQGEKFYCYVGWLQYLISHFFAPWGVTLDGTIKWKGDMRGDSGSIRVEGNRIIVNTQVTKTTSELEQKDKYSQQ